MSKTQVRQQCMFIGPAFRNLLISLCWEGCTNKAKLEREAMDIGVRLLADLNDLCRSSFDLYALQFVPCIWGKFVRGLARLLHAEPGNVQDVLASLSMSERRRLKERIMFLESRAISEFWRKCDTLKCNDEMHATSGRNLRCLIDRVCWDEIAERCQLLELLRKIGAARNLEEDIVRPHKRGKHNSSRQAPMCAWRLGGF